MNLPNSSILRMNDADTLRFVNLYETEPVLWNTTLAKYKNREARAAAVQRIAEAVRLKDFGPQHVLMKFKNLRSSYCQELKKIAESEKAGDDVYVPKVVWFTKMNSFLRPFVQSRAAQSNMRTYGKWWKESEGYQLEYRQQDVDTLGAEDYITLEFEYAVVPRDICIYEIYNPGAVVRIWGKLLCPAPHPWILLWEGPPQICPHKSRKFHPNIRKLNYLMNTIRLEFNQSHLQYHFSIDAILLGGVQPSTPLQYNMMIKGLVNDFQKPVKSKPKPANICDITSDTEALFNSDSEDLFLSLPYEVMFHIFQYLDLKSLSRCAQVSRRWSEVAADPALYQNISLKPYWYLVNCATLEYIMNKCNALKKLDLSWCGNDTQGFGDQLILCLRKYCNTLTHLSLGNCTYLNIEIMVEISACKELLDLRVKNINQWMQPSLEHLNKLVSLDLTSTDIQDDDLIRILKANPHLKHIILDLCEHLSKLDQVVQTVVSCNKNLTTWSSWKTSSLTADGVKLFGFCHSMKELDLGWCLVSNDPGDCLEHVAVGCRQLRRLILSGWRGVSENVLMFVFTTCKELTHLDLLGIQNVYGIMFNEAFVLLPKLRLLDISFCGGIEQYEVERWRQQYPHITIQRSCQYVVNDYLN